MSSNELAPVAQPNAAHPAERRKFIPKPAGIVVYASVILCIMAAKAAVLFLMGNDVVCPCGVQLWLNDSTGAENSKHIADWYSVSHVLAGMLFAGVMWLTSRRWPLGWMIVAAAAFSAGWEVIENTPWIISQFGNTRVGANYTGDTILNSLFDSAFVMAGFVAALRLPLVVSIGLVVLAEVVSAFMIGDSLVLATVRFVVGLF